MKIREISVHAGRTFNDPYESFSNFRPGITLRAELEDGEDATEAIKALRFLAETEVDLTKAELLKAAEVRENAERERWAAEAKKEEDDGDAPF